MAALLAQIHMHDDRLVRHASTPSEAKTVDSHLRGLAALRRHRLEQRRSRSGGGPRRAAQCAANADAQVFDIQPGVVPVTRVSFFGLFDATFVFSTLSFLARTTGVEHRVRSAGLR